MTIDLNTAIWLAIRQMRDMWSAYAFTAVYFAFMGATLAFDTSMATEIAHPVLMLILIQPAVSARYMTWKQDNDVTRHQQFLRSLPLSFGTIITARVINMLMAGVINAPLYFAWFWYVGDNWSSFGAFLAWVVFWTGIAIGCAGISLIQEFWLTIRRWSTINFVVIIALVCIFPPIFWLTDTRPVASSMDIAQNSPWLLAVGGMFIGCTALWGSLHMAVSYFRRREYAT